MKLFLIFRYFEAELTRRQENFGIAEISSSRLQQVVDAAAGSRSMQTDFMLDALEQALYTRQPKRDSSLNLGRLKRSHLDVSQQSVLGTISSTKSRYKADFSSSSKYLIFKVLLYLTANPALSAMNSKR